MLYGIIVDEDCNKNSVPGLYIDVYYHRDWIIESGIKGLRSCVNKLNNNVLLLLLCITIMYLFAFINVGKMNTLM